MSSIQSQPWPAGLLAAMLVVGVLMIGKAALGDTGRVRDGPGIATVNGWSLTREEFENAAKASNSETPAQRAQLLQYLIDEELLIERAREIGLLEGDPQLHKIIVRQTVAAITRAATEARPAGIADATAIRAYRVQAATRALCAALAQQRGASRIWVSEAYPAGHPQGSTDDAAECGAP